MDSNGKRNRDNALYAISQSNACLDCAFHCSPFTADFIFKTFITSLKLTIRTLYFINKLFSTCSLKIYKNSSSWRVTVE